MFFECDELQIIWHYVSNIIQKNITYKMIVTNMVMDNPKHVQNVIVLIAKQFIYKCRCSAQKPSIVNLWNVLKDFRTTELYNAKMKNKLNLHEIKWSNIVL